MDIIDFNVSNEHKFNPHFKGLNQSDVNTAINLLNNFDTLKFNLAKCEDAQKFYKIEPIFRDYIPYALFSEYFFTMKLGYAFEGISSLSAYFIEKVYKEYGTINLLSVVCPKPLIEQVVAGSAIPFCEVVKEVLGYDKELLTHTKYYANNGEFYDIPIFENNRIAIVNETLKNKINWDTLEAISVTKQGLFLGTTLLSKLGGRFGATAGIYDLSRIL